MPTMLGSIPSDPWEREVYRQLKLQLPADWVAIANVAWSRQGPSDDWRYVRDGQSDFVVLAPGLGMAVVEVKGSRGFRIGDDGRWYRIDARGGEQVIDKSPPEQANHNMHELVDAALKKAGWLRFPGLYAYLVAYPQGKLVGTPLHMYDSSTVVVATQMHDLAGRIRAALLARGSQQVGTAFTKECAARLAEIFTSQALKVTKVDTPVDVAADARGIDILTQQQFAALQGIFSLPRVAVAGPAGSGKTVLAMWRLAALLEAGKEAAYVCFNKALADSLRRRNPALAGSIHSVDRWFHGMVAEAGKLPARHEINRDVDTFFRDDLPGIVMDVVNDDPTFARLDALLVDEGQDFSEARLIALLELLKQDSTYTFFADWRQDVFRMSTSGAVGADVIFSLHHNCRNTSRINAVTNRLVTGDIPSMPGVPEGVDPLVLHPKDAAAMAAQAWKLAHEWRAPGEQVVILSPWTLERSAMHGSPTGYGLQLVSDLADWKGDNTVYFSTIKSFKGIEASSVIVVDLVVPGSVQGFGEEDLYVACTRAKTRLGLLTRDRSAATWLVERASAPVGRPTMPPAS